MGSFYYEFLVFQSSDKKRLNIFDIYYYKILHKYLDRAGINPYQNDRNSNILVSIIVLLSLTFFIPVSLDLYHSIRNMDTDGIMLDLPHTIAGIASILKLLNLRSNKSDFRKLFDFVAKGWKLLEGKDELLMLDKFTRQGSKLAAIYRNTLLTMLGIFISLPLLNPILDIVLPLNETRVRYQIFKVNYIIVDEYEYFYAVYVHLSLCSCCIVFCIVTADSMYITVIHHASGLFAVCGYQIQNATESNSKENDGRNQRDIIKQCVMTHHEALLFHITLEKCCSNLYLIQMGLNIIIISVTAIEVIIFLNRPDELARALVFLVAQNFHLYVVSIPGQVLLDQSVGLGDTIYTSKWYEEPLYVQKILYVMQIRCNKPCILTAGGLYDMKIESFGMTIKACMSYITMFSSMRE